MMNKNLADHYITLFDDIRAGKTDALTTHYAGGGKGVQRKGQTLLMCAIEANNSAAVDMILATSAGQWGLNNLVDRQGNTALHYAYAASNQQFVQRLLAKVSEATLQRRNIAGQLPEDGAVIQTPVIAQEIATVTPPALPTSPASGLNFLLAQDDLSNRISHLYHDHNLSPVSSRNFFNGLKKRYKFEVDRNAATTQWIEDFMWFSADGKYAFRPQTSFVDEAGIRPFWNFISALSPDIPGAEEEGHHSFNVHPNHHDQGKKSNSQWTALTPGKLEKADEMAAELGMEIIKTLSVIEGGNMLTGHRADGRPYVIIGRDAVLQTTFINKQTYSDALVDDKLKTFTPKDDAIHRMSIMLKAGGFIDKSLTEDEIKKTTRRFLAMNEISKDIIADELNVKIEDLIIISQPDFHIDMYLRPLKDGRVLVHDDEESQKFIRQVLDGDQSGQLTEYQKEGLERTWLDLGSLKQESKKVTELIHHQLEKAGLQAVKTPGVFMILGGPGLPINFLNGIMGTSPSGEMFYLTNGSSIEPLNQAFSAWIQEKQPGLETHFIDSGNAESMLRSKGGLDCITLHHGTENLAQQMAAFPEGRVSVSSTSAPIAEKTVAQLASYSNSLDSSVRVA